MKQVNLSLLRLFKHFFSCYHGNSPPPILFRPGIKFWENMLKYSIEANEVSTVSNKKLFNTVNSNTSTIVV